MGITSSAYRRLRARFLRDRLDDELAEEIRLHTDLRIQALIDDGMEPAAAAREARRIFGNAAVIREDTRDMWEFPWVETLLQDLRYGARLLRRAPWFTAVAVLSLAIGIGATSAVFNLADAVLLRSLDVRNPHELRGFRAELRAGGAVKSLGGVAEDVFAALQHQPEIGNVIGFRESEAVALGDASAVTQAVRAHFVSGNYFDDLGVPARAGRTLNTGDTGEGAIPVVLSERLWSSGFDRDPDIAGRRVTINDAPAYVAGVARAFRGVVADRPADIFVPLAGASAIDPGLAETQIRVVVRLAPGASTAAAEGQIENTFRASPESMLRAGQLTVSLTDASRGLADSRAPLARPVQLGLALAAVLLLVACANTGGLLVARFATRQGEFGVRIAIGAGRARLARQLTVEALLIALLAAVVSLGVAWVAAPLLLRSMPVAAVPPAFELRFDWRLVGFTAAVSVIAALIATGASLIRLSRTDPSLLLALDSRTTVRGRRALNDIMIAAQVACSLLLLTAAGAMGRTLFNLQQVNAGFDPRLTFGVTVATPGPARQPAESNAYYSQLLERIAAAPPVERVSLVQIGLMSGAATTGTMNIPGFVPAADEDRWVRMFFVGPGFFETTGMRVIRGERLDAHHLSGGDRVAVVNERTARFYFGEPDRAIGATVNGNVRIIGVVADAHYDTLRETPARAVFVPFTQAPPRRQMTYIVRATDPAHPEAAIAAVSSVVRAFDPRLTFTIATGSDRLASTMVRERFTARLAAVLSLLALFLSCLGLYAAVAYAVSERRHELAVRLALGASRLDIVRLVVRAPLRATVIGVMVAMPGVYALRQALSALLFGVAQFDAALLALSTAALIMIAVVASMLPARRAGQIDPQACLRCR